jgi:tetraacyldisaccharide 4'-kinase
MNPFSAIFGAGVALRNALYDRRVFKVRKLSRPVVSIGNLSVGGAGKTPFVIALGQLLKNRGIEFDVLSRGYGRRAGEVVVVDSQGSSIEFGDEPLLIARKLQVPVIVGTERYVAGLLAEKKFSSQLHLLDDGFQHRRLHRDFDIVIVRDEDLHDTLLPMGRLREPLSSWRRADVIVTLDQGAYPVKRVWVGRRQITVPATGDKMIAFCGIARPKQFFDQLRQAGVKIAETVAFPDHYRFGESDISRLSRLKMGSGAGGFITTEKDMINLGAGALQGRLQPLHVARLDIVLADPQAALGDLLTTLESRCGCRFPPPA